MFKAEIVADSINQHGDRLTSVLVTFPRIVLAEVNTHRMLCLSGDSMLSFDLPTSARGSKKFKHYQMSIRDFVEKWHKGAKKRKRHSYTVNLENKNYTAKEISKLIGKDVSNIRSKCRDKTIKVQNPNKRKNEDFIINGLDYNNYHNGYELKGQNVKNRLKTMKIRVLNEDTGLIEHSNVKDCFISGEKDVFELVLSNGYSIKCSKDHRILTEEGWKTLENITVNDYVIVQSFGIKENERSDPKDLKFIDGKWVQTFLRKLKPEIEKKQNQKCLNCDNSIEDLHHIIPVHKDKSKAFDVNNIVGLCKKCHDKEHQIQNWQPSKYLYGKGVSVKSINYVGVEQTYDLEIEGPYHNFVANGIVVHNSKNTSSSRAVPFKKMVEAVQNNPFTPIAWQKHHSGMQGTEYITDKLSIQFAISNWLSARDEAVKSAQALNRSDNGYEGVTKQLCNRLLEPFMWTTMLITGSKEGWDNFFELRCPQYVTLDNTTYKSWKDLIEDKENKAPKEWIESAKKYNILEKLQCNRGQAEIHIMHIAEMIYDAMNKSTPKQLKPGQWHIPFEDKINSNILDWSDDIKVQAELWGKDLTMHKVKVSTAMAARTSYTVVGDEKEVDYEKMIKLHDKLIELNHRSPLEHCAKVVSDEEYNNSFKGQEKGWFRNYKGFKSYRQIIEE